VAHGLSAINYVVNLKRGSVVDLPDRMAKRLVKIGLATE